MKRVFIALLAGAFFLCVESSSDARAPRWVKVGEGNDAVFYYLPDMVRKNGNLVQVWNLIDLNVPKYEDNKAFQSSMTLKLFDCASQLVQVKLIIAYSGRMGTGDVVDSGVLSAPPDPVVPGSMDSGLLDTVCK